jgi:hypothetical protein
MAGGGRSRGRPGEDEEVGRGRFWQLAFVAGSFVVASFSRAARSVRPRQAIWAALSFFVLLRPV